mgnify:CR=1 FL=1
MTGPRFMLVSALGFALMSALVKEAGQLGIPLLQIIFVRAVISVVLSLADIHRAGAHPLGHRRVLLFGRGLSGFLALTGVFYALLHLSMAQATILQYLHPVFTALLAFVFLAERPTAATLACITLSLLALARSRIWQRGAARFSGVMLLVFAAGVIADAVRRFLEGSEPGGFMMLAMAAVAAVAAAGLVFGLVALLARLSGTGWMLGLAIGAMIFASLSSLGVSAGTFVAAGLLGAAYGRGLRREHPCEPRRNAAGASDDAAGPLRSA